MRKNVRPYVASRYKDVSFLKTYDNFEKKLWQDILNNLILIQYRRLTDRVVLMIWLCYSHAFENVYKNLIN